MAAPFITQILIPWFHFRSFSHVCSLPAGGPVPMEPCVHPLSLTERRFTITIGAKPTPVFECLESVGSQQRFRIS